MPEGTTTDVVVTVVDQRGAPVAGAQVLHATDGEPAYTDFIHAARQGLLP